MAATRQRLFEYVTLLSVLAGLCLVFGVSSKYFLTATTFSAISNQIPSLTVMAVGMTFVLLIGGLDLSVGSVMAFSGTLLAIALTDWHWPLLFAGLVSLGAGVVCGLISGSVVVFFRAPSFIVTLGMMELARGAAYLVADSRTKYIGSSIEVLGTHILGGISLATVLALALVGLGQYTLNRTIFGRYVIGIGSEEAAMHLSGIDVRASKVVVFVIAGLMSAVAAIFSSARLEAADPNAGAGIELQVIAAVVIGGTSPLGGRGSVAKTLLGVLIISVLEYGLAQIGATEPAKRFITGFVIVVAVILDLNRKQGPPFGVH